jgi:hypothetical protein
MRLFRVIQTLSRSSFIFARELAIELDEFSQLSTSQASQTAINAKPAAGTNTQRAVLVTGFPALLPALDENLIAANGDKLDDGDGDEVVDENVIVLKPPTTRRPGTSVLCVGVTVVVAFFVDESVIVLTPPMTRMPGTSVLYVGLTVVVAFFVDESVIVLTPPMT